MLHSYNEPINISMKKIVHPALLALIILTACNTKKERPLPPPDNHFINTRLTHFSGPRLFTHSGEITDQGIVQACFTQFNNYFFNPAAKFNNANYQEVQFINEDSLLYYTSTFVYATKRTATGNYDKFSTPYFSITDDTNALDLHIAQYKTYHPVQAPGGWVFYEVENPVIFLKKVQDTIFVPIVRYITFYRKDYVVSFASNDFNNVFSPEGINKLGVNDTLLVQGFDVAMERRK